MDKFIVSSFDGSDHNPFNKIFLYKWINQNDRKTGHYDKGVFHGFSPHHLFIHAGKVSSYGFETVLKQNIPENNLKRKKILIPKIQNCIEKGIPMAYCIEKNNYGDDGS